MRNDAQLIADEGAHEGVVDSGPCQENEAMTTIDIAKLENAGRSAMAWTPDDRDARTSVRNVLGAMIPAMGIIATAAVFLTAIAA